MPGRQSLMPAWIKSGKGKEQIIVSSRVRLARNVKQFRFPAAMDATEQKKLLDAVESFLQGQSFKPNLQFNRLRDLDKVERSAMAECGLFQSTSAQEPNNTALALGPGQSLSWLINEEDHFRLQVVAEGLNLVTCLGLAKELDDKISRRFELATHKEFGFLTACPTNVGTGLRASVMLHLPGLALSKGIVQVLQAVLHMGLAVRGFNGEGTEIRSDFFQVSNQVTLGRSEEEIIQHLLGVAGQIVDREKEARRQLLQSQPKLLADRVGRAVGILANCRLLGFEEALDLLSTIRLGSEIKLLGKIPGQLQNELVLQIQPAHLQLAATENQRAVPMPAEEELAKRAALVRRRLKLYLNFK